MKNEKESHARREPREEPEGVTAWTEGPLAATRGLGCRDICRRGKCVRKLEKEKGNEKGNYWNIS